MVNDGLTLNPQMSHIPATQPQIAEPIARSAMRDFDSNGLTSADDYPDAIHTNVVVTRVAGDKADPDRDLSKTALSKLRSSNHQLRAENLALRSRIERLKSNRSVETCLIVVGMLSLWFFFILSVITKLIAPS